ncbi:MAG TPA: hypothetical protein VMV56_08855 [Williamwhitmania sp.]|nr:hypothetical protein [Williamwhitmania sp.]
MVRVKVGESCSGYLWWYGIYEAKKERMRGRIYYERKGNASRGAKAMAKKIGVKYSDEIIKQHGC